MAVAVTAGRPRSDALPAAVASATCPQVADEQLPSNASLPSFKWPARCKDQGRVQGQAVTAGASVHVGGCHKVGSAQGCPAIRLQCQGRAFSVWFAGSVSCKGFRFGLCRVGCRGMQCGQERSFI